MIISLIIRHDAGMSENNLKIVAEMFCIYPRMPYLCSPFQLKKSVLLQWQQEVVKDENVVSVNSLSIKSLKFISKIVQFLFCSLGNSFYLCTRFQKESHLAAAAAFQKQKFEVIIQARQAVFQPRKFFKNIPVFILQSREQSLPLHPRLRGGFRSDSHESDL